MLLPLGLSYNEHPEKSVSVESVVNMQPELSYGGRQQIILRSCPGLPDFAQTNETICRGFTKASNLLYAVIGKNLYSFTGLAASTKIGRIDGEGKCGIATSGEQVFIATGSINYVYTIATNELVIEPTSPNGRVVSFLNGRFVIEDPEATGDTAGRFWWSGVLDGKSWNGLDFATAEQKPDRTISHTPNNGRLVLFGEESIEYWRSDAQGFIPITGTSQSIGIAGPYAFGQIDNTVCFLASDGSVRIINGYQTIPVSTPAVEAALGADSATECVAYREEGHTVFEFSNPDLTLCYDFNQSQLIGKPVWFKKSTNVDPEKLNRHRVNNVIYAFGKNIAGVNDSGNLYELSRDAYPDMREFTIPHIADDNSRNWERLSNLELLCRSGTGAVPDIQPKVIMQISRDNGYTWGEEKWVDMGTLGDYDKRLRWRRLGRFLQFTVRFRVTDQVEFTVTGLNANGR